MIATVADILAMAAPLLFATLGALCTEYAGVLAVFMDGTITFAGFVCVAVTGASGSPIAGFAAAALASMLLLFAVARFTEATRANPFLTGLAVNLFAAGIIPRLSSAWYGTRGVVSLASLGTTVAFSRALVFPAALTSAILLALFLRFTQGGLSLRISGSSPDVLTARGVSASGCRTASWVTAAFFASCAGSVLVLDLGAYVPNVSSGRTALAAVYLGYKKPLLCVVAVLVFAVAEYATNILQGTGRIPATVILGLPYALALLVFVLVRRKD